MKNKKKKKKKKKRKDSKAYNQTNNSIVAMHQIKSKIKYAKIE